MNLPPTTGAPDAHDFATKGVAGQPVRAPASNLNPGAAAGVSGCKVLISDEHYKHTLGIVRHLGKLGAEVTVVASARDSLVCRSKYCKEIILTDSKKWEDVVSAILKTVRHRQFDLVMPVSFPMTLALAERKNEFPDHIPLELAPAETIARAANKVWMIELAGKMGVPAPKTIVPQGLKNLDRQMSGLQLPVVIKPQKESPGRSPVRYASNLEELKQILCDSFSKDSFLPAEAPLIQEFIPGNGCGFFATYQNGICKRVFMHRRVREYPASGGASSCAESFYDAKLEFYGRRMLDALQWHGVAMVEFRHDTRDGEFKLMEINPKFWGSLDLALAAGANFPVDLCEMALGRDLTFTDAYDRNLRFQWPLSGHGDFFHLWTRPQSIFQVALDLCNPAVKSNVWLSDPQPNLQEFSAIVRRFFPGARNR